MARYLLLTTHYKPLIGGAMEVYDNLARHLNGQLVVLTASGDYAAGNEPICCEDFDEKAPYPILRLPEITYATDHSDSVWRRLTRNAMVLRALYLAVKRLNIDVVLLTVPHRLGWLGWWVRHLMRRPVVFYLHGEEIATFYKPAQRRMLRRSLGRAQRVIVPSRFSADVVADFAAVAADRISIIPNGVDFGRFVGLVDGRRWRDKNRLTSDLDKGPMVAGLGRLVPRKGFDRLIEAWPNVLQKHPAARLIIAGDGPDMPRLKELCAAHKLQHHIHLAGEVSDADIVTLFSEADIFAMPNRAMADGDTEGFGVVFLEAGLFGLPLIGGKAGGVPEALRDGKAGLLVDGDSSSEIADAICQVIEDAELRRELGAAAKENAQRSGWASKAQKLRKILQEVRSSPRS